MTKKQHYMTREERYQLEALRRAKISVSEIARLLGFTRQTIYNELRRGEYVHDYGWYEKKEYSADKGQQVHEYMQTGNGSEFLEYEQLTKSVKSGKRFDVYYCHSYAAWEKGSVENHNRMIRRWFPKGTDFSKVTKKRIAAVQDWMNNYPRKILNWKTPIEARLYYNNSAESTPGSAKVCYDLER